MTEYMSYQWQVLLLIACPHRPPRSGINVRFASPLILYLCRKLLCHRSCYNFESIFTQVGCSRPYKDEDWNLRPCIGRRVVLFLTMLGAVCARPRVLQHGCPMPGATAKCHTYFSSWSLVLVEAIDLCRRRRVFNRCSSVHQSIAQASSARHIVS